MVFSLAASQRQFGRPPAEAYVFHFMRYALKHVNVRWRSATSPYLTLEDMASIAAETLARTAATFPDWAVEHQLNPYSPEIFWASTRTQIDYALHNAVTKARREAAARSLYVAGAIEGEEEPIFDGDPRTQLRNYQPPSILASQLVLELRSLTGRQLLAMCLYHFEELTWEQVAELLEVALVTLKRDVREASQIFRFKAMALTLDEFSTEAHRRSTTPYEPSAALRRWVFRYYGTDPKTYVEYVLLHFRADVSYLVDLLDSAAGDRVVHRAHQRSEKGMCTHEGCERLADHATLCKTHYGQRPTAPRCSIEGCDGARSGWGLCPKHYQQEKRRRVVAEILQ